MIYSGTLVTVPKRVFLKIVLVAKRLAVDEVDLQPWGYKHIMRSDASVNNACPVKRVHGKHNLLRNVRTEMEVESGLPATLLLHKGENRASGNIRRKDQHGDELLLLYFLGSCVSTTRRATLCGELLSITAAEIVSTRRAVVPSSAAQQNNIYY
jgi:hypothetical protein